MATHKYRVGQMVGFNPAPRFAPHGAIRGYKILRLLPPEGGEYLYRIKSITETVERVVRECDLVPRLGGGR
jgi:hypothetical protein